MTANPTDLLLLALLCGVFACAYHAILIAPGHILSGARKFIEERLFLMGTRTMYGRKWRVLTWLTKSIVDCEYCLAGQVAAFVFLYRGGRDLVDLSLFTAAAILCGALLFKLFKHGKADK